MQKLCKIKFNVCDLPDQKIKENYGCYIDLFPTHIVYRLMFKAEEPIDKEDTGMGHDIMMNDFETFILKRNISGIEKVFCTDTSLWRIEIATIGGLRDPKIYYEKKKEAEAMYLELVNYLTTEYVEPV